MGKTFVYNSGVAEDNKKDEELWFDYGVFIDGTLNNKENTRLRRKYRNEDENSILTKKKKDADREIEKEDYESYKETGLTRVPELYFKDLSKFDAKEYIDYLSGIYRTDMDKASTDNSYSNDDTNVTRMWKCCTEDYKIYVEGMGTADKAYDSQDGFAFGSGQTGIRMRVRLACERIAERIFDFKKGENAQKKVTQITLDVFGFSRGAASARNFIHEVNAKGPYSPHEIKIPDGYYPTKPFFTRDEGPKQKYRAALGDDDGMEIDTAGLIDGMLPRMGYLGYYLLKNKIVSPEELAEIRVIVRFVGVYDTVSSYYEIGALGEYDDFGKTRDDNKLAKLVSFSSKDFENDENQLGLQDLGDANRFQKMVHFTAKDEHRRNFSLTRINQIPNKAIEKNFPGVHCDIGGAYENEEEECIDEIGTSIMDGEYVNEDASKTITPWQTTSIPKIGLKALKQDLIDQYWYKEGEELKIAREYDSFKWIADVKVPIPTYFKLTGTRTIRKEYSYIPLHFMEEFCRDTTMSQFFNRETAKNYPLNNPFLDKVKKSLHQYVFGDAPEWEFISDAQLQEYEEEREEIGREMIRKEAENVESDKEHPGIVYIEEEETKEEETIEVQLPELKIDNLNKQIALRKLRHEYLHWSSNRDWFGMEPNTNRKRAEFPKK